MAANWPALRATTVAMISTMATMETSGSRGSSLAVRECSQTLARTPMTTGISTILSRLNSMSSTGTSTLLPASSCTSSGVMITPSKVESAVMVMERATSPLAR
ncbi:hypothetical protein D3C81_2038380 [compost metagenome]